MYMAGVVGTWGSCQRLDTAHRGVSGFKVTFIYVCGRKGVQSPWWPEWGARFPGAVVTVGRERECWIGPQPVRVGP